MFKRKDVFTGHTGSVYALEKLSTESFVSGSGDKIVARWQLQQPESGELFIRVPEIVYKLKFIPSTQQMLAGTAGGSIHVISIRDAAETNLLQYHKQGIFDMAVSAIHNLMVTAGGDGIITFCRLNDFGIIKQESLCSAKLRSVCFSTDDKLIAIGCGDGSIVIYDALNLSIVNRLQAHKEGWSTNIVKFHPTQTLLLSASRDAMIHVFDTKNNFTLLESIAAHNYAIYDIQFSPDNKLIATASRDKSVKIWNSDDLNFVQKLDKEKSDGHVNSVNKILWIDENNLLSCGDDRSIILWEQAGQ